MSCLIENFHFLHVSCTGAYLTIFDHKLPEHGSVGCYSPQFESFEGEFTLKADIIDR